MSEINEDSTSSDKQFENVFKLIPNPIYIFERVGNDLILIEYNNAAKLFSKGKIDEYLGFKMSDLYPEHLDLIEELKNAVDIKGHLSRESKFKSKSTGIEKTVNTTWYKIRPNLIMVILYDITEQRQVEDALRKSEREKSLIIENIPELIVFQDTNHNIIWCNKAAHESVDLSLKQIIGRKCFEIWQNRNLVCENCSVDIALKTGRQGKAEAITPDGRIWDIRGYPVRDDNGNIVGAIELTTDITERKKAEQELLEKNIEQSVLNRIITLGNESQSLQEFLEISYEQVLDAIGFDRGGIYLYDAETQHNILIVHKNLHPDFVAAVEDVDMSEGLFSKLFDEDNSFFIEDFSEFMENSKELGVYSAVIFPLRSKDEYVGSMNVGSSVHQILSQNDLEFLVAIGKQMGIIIQKFESETLLKQSEEKYRDAFNRSELYKDIFTHDINNILQNILTSTELSKLYSNDPDQSEKVKEVSNLMNEQIIRGKKLVSNVQKLSEVEEFETPIASVEVSSILSKAIEFVKESFLFRDIKIEVQSFQNQFFVNANELLVNIFENIIFNAVKHNVHENIEILIRISKDRKNEKNCFKFEFLDNGVGIPDSMKPEIFSRKSKEYKKDNIPSGIGLGLLLVNRILVSYNGEIRVEDRIEGDYSKGSNFIIFIPEAV